MDHEHRLYDLNEDILEPGKKRQRLTIKKARASRAREKIYEEDGRIYTMTRNKSRNKERRKGMELAYIYQTIHILHGLHKEKRRRT